MQESTAIQHAADVLRFVRGIDTPSSRSAMLSTAIANSWRRCVQDYALDPGHRLPARVLDSQSLRSLHEQHAELVHIASAEIDWLYEHIAGSGYALLLTDASGIILYEKSEPTLAESFHDAGLLTGADWSEPSQGTNGMGTCIVERRAVTVHLDEHFHGCHIGLSCSAAPICDPSGALLAVLDASTMDARDTRVSQAHTMALVSLSARLIEKCVFLRHFRDAIMLRFHARPELVNLQHDGALALAPDATVLSADETAIRLLGARSRNDLIGRRIDEVFDVRPEESWERSSTAAVACSRCAMRILAGGSSRASARRRPRLRYRREARVRFRCLRSCKSRLRRIAKRRCNSKSSRAMTRRCCAMCAAHVGSHLRKCPS